MSTVETLRERGYRITPQRAMILAAIQSSDDHISAEEIYAQVHAKNHRVNISTVYRTLGLLKELGLVMETDLGGGRFRYHFVDKGHHHHLICQRCGQVFELNESVIAPFKEAVLREHKFRAEMKHLALFGHCLRCKELFCWPIIATSCNNRPTSFYRYLGCRGDFYGAYIISCPVPGPIARGAPCL